MRFTWRTVSDVLLDKELKNALGGYGNGYSECGPYLSCTCTWKNDYTESGCCGSTDALECLNMAKEKYPETDDWWGELLQCVCS